MILFFLWSLLWPYDQLGVGDSLDNWLEPLPVFVTKAELNGLCSLKEFNYLLDNYFSCGIEGKVMRKLLFWYSHFVQIWNILCRKDLKKTCSPCFIFQPILSGRKIFKKASENGGYLSNSNMLQPLKFSICW